MNKKIIAVAIVIFIMVSILAVIQNLQGETMGQKISNILQNKELSDEEKAEKLVEGMTLEEKVGQMFFVHCPGANAVKNMKEYQFGGYALYLSDFKDDKGDWLTAEQIKKKHRKYDKVSKIAPLMGVDEEGGTVARVSLNPHVCPEGKCAAPREIYKSSGAKGLKKDIRKRSKILKSIKVNVNFAPVADVVTDPSAYMYERAIGEDAGKTAELTNVMTTAMEEEKLGAVLKHFPGYGNNMDTHNMMEHTS